MPLTDRIKDVLGASEDQELTYRYHCRECDEEFEAQEQSRSKITCPNCGASEMGAFLRL